MAAKPAGAAEPLAPNRLLRWYAAAARDLPWRSAEVTSWGVLVSEVMLQQTPVSRVLPAYDSWLRRWPTPADCATATAADVVREWGKLGYPRRALRLREAAIACVERHRGEIPCGIEELRSLPGVGAYTAAAVAAFAFGARTAVVDTNVKRVVVRAIGGVDDPRPVGAADRAAVTEALPMQDAARWSIAVMELGALICRATSPRCARCPIADDCAWFGAGAPGWEGATKRPQRYAGTDRQVRGRILDLLRAAHHPVPSTELDGVWHLAEQRERALASLVEDGLAVKVGSTYALPT